MELVAEPADRAALSRGGGLPDPLLGDRRAAGQRRRCRASRGKFAGISMRDWEPVCAGGEAGYTAPIRCTPKSSTAIASPGATSSPARRKTYHPSGNDGPARHTWTLPLCSHQPIRTRSITAISFSSRRPTAANTGRRISPDLTRRNSACRRISTKPPRPTRRGQAPRGHLHDRALFTQGRRSSGSGPTMA